MTIHKHLKARAFPTLCLDTPLQNYGYVIFLNAYGFILPMQEISPWVPIKHIYEAFRKRWVKMNGLNQWRRKTQRLNAKGSKIIACPMVMYASQLAVNIHRSLMSGRKANETAWVSKDVQKVIEGVYTKFSFHHLMMGHTWPWFQRGFPCPTNARFSSLGMQNVQLVCTCTWNCAKAAVCVWGKCSGNCTFTWDPPFCIHIACTTACLAWLKILS